MNVEGVGILLHNAGWRCIFNYDVLSLSVHFSLNLRKLHSDNWTQTPKMSAWKNVRPAWDENPQSKIPSEVIPNVGEWISHIWRHLISNLKWLRTVNEAARNAYGFDSIGFKLGHTAIKTAKLVERSVTAVCHCWLSTEAAVFRTAGSLQQ